ncbi:MAG: hypothetical protein NXI31_20575 [bacterium]|nr:hypothetical protein [bacterium]
MRSNLSDHASVVRPSSLAGPEVGSWGRGVALVAILAVGSAAQSFVWPAGYANAAGNSAQEMPFSVSANHAPLGSRSTVLMTAQSLVPLVNRTITSIAFRRDRQNTGNYPAIAGAVEVHMGPVPSGLQTRRPHRDVFSSPPTRVVKGNLTVPPAQYTAGVSPFTLVIPFDEPYTYTGGDLGIDILFTTSTPATWRRDAVWVDPGTEGRIATLGAGVLGSNGVAPSASIEAGSFYPGGALISRVEGLPTPAGQLVVQYLGQKSNPFPLQGFGFPVGTELHVLPYLNLSLFSSDRSANFSRALTALSLPSTPALSGTTFAMQWAALDLGLPAAIPLNVTNGLEVTIGLPPAQTSDWGRTLWARGNNQVGVDLSTSIGPVDYVPVIEFRYF